MTDRLALNPLAFVDAAVLRWPHLSTLNKPRIHLHLPFSFVHSHLMFDLSSDASQTGREVIACHFTIIEIVRRHIHISGDMLLTPAYGRFRCMSPVYRWPSNVHLLYTHTHQQSARQVFSLANSKNIFLPIKIIIISATFLHLAFCLRSQCFLTSLWWNSSPMKTGLVSETLSGMANDVLGICMRLLPVLLLPNYNTNI